MSEMEKKEPYCPFYLQDTRCSITCEGMMTNECMMHRFKNSREKEDWMDAACRSPKCAHRCIAANMLESIYEQLLEAELARRGHKVERQKPVSIEHEGVVVDNAFRLDLLVDEKVVVELKSTEQHSAVFAKQLKTYLVLCEKSVGLLINFGQISLRNGIERVVNRYEGPTLSPRGEEPRKYSVPSP